MRTVAFYSYKGGVGRTLLLANVARFVALSGKKVVALDFDFEAPGLHYKLGSLEVLARAREGSLRGAVDALVAVLSDSGGRSIADLAIAIDLPSDCRGSLHIIPAGSAPSGQYWTALARLAGVSQTENIRGGLADAVLDLQARIADELTPDFLLVDARTGITELGGLATTVLADHVVCLTTISQESIEGTCLVADAVRKVPRLPGQAEIKLDFLLTRIDVMTDAGALLAPAEVEVEFDAAAAAGGTDGRANGSKLTFSAVLVHDRAIANQEMVLGRERAHDRHTTLFEASLAWIERAFPSLAAEAEQARKRMAEVERARRELTDDFYPSLDPEQLKDGRRWPTNRLRLGVRFQAKGTDAVPERFADIVAYDRPAHELGAKAILVAEYVVAEDLHGVAQWWIETCDIAVVCLLGEQAGERRLFARSFDYDGVRISERRDLPMPYEFTALHDPTDVSVETLLDAVRRGYHDYVPRLMQEWILATSHPHGGGPWAEGRGQQILDGLASISDPKIATQVLRAVSPDSHNRRMWLGSDDDSIDALVWRELFTPLWWRLPAEASIAVALDHHRELRPARHMALRMLAEDLLGLRYAPDEEFRRPEAHGLRAGPLEIVLEQRSGDPPIAWQTESFDDKEAPKDRIIRLAQRLVQSESVVTNGFLGDYEPDEARVVLYDAAIEATALNLSVPRRSLATITMLHETVLALAHVGRDLDERRWHRFNLQSAASPGFEPSSLHATIAQYFSYRFLLHMGDQSLLDTFEELAKHQPPAYQEWRKISDRPLEEMRAWLMSIRRQEVVGTTPFT